MTGYAELQVTTNYSFLRGASHPEELFAQAKLLGLPALGITDRNSLAGIVRCHQRAEEAGVRMLVGCRLDLTDGTSLLVYPQDRPGYARLCRLLSARQKPRRQGCAAIWPGRMWPRMPTNCWPCCCPISPTTRCDRHWRGCVPTSATAPISR